MWTLLDLLARVVCVGGFVLVGWFLYQITREPSADTLRRCLDCRRPLDSVSLVHCGRCLAVSDV